MKGKLFVKIMMIVGMQAIFAGCVGSVTFSVSLV